jgi:Zn-dependent peptidase ImmA (M78 family)
MVAIRKARYTQSIVQELQENEIEYEFKSIILTDDSEKAGLDFLSLLSVSMEERKKWSNPGLALRGWKDSVERLGIFILQQSLPKDDVSAFCLADEKPYVILLNSAEHENRRIFSLFHEIGHILLHRSGVCTPDNFSRNSFDYIKIEKFCNQFAASVLVPVSDFKSNDIVLRLSKSAFENWDTEDIRSLAGIYKVSQEVIYRRFVQIGVLNEKKYEQKRSELIKAFEEYKKRGKKKVIIPQYRKIISKNGRAFTSLVLHSLNESRITLTDVSNFLGTTSKHISAVEANI